MPVVTISSIKDVTRISQKGKKYKVVEVKGTKYGTDNEEWSTDIFKNKTDLIDSLDDFAPGETVNFKFQKNGNFYDLTDIAEPTEENLEFAKKAASSETGGPANSGGKSKGGWNGRTGEAYDRSSSIYLAMDIATENKTAKGKIKVEDLIEMAEDIFEYIHNGDNVYAAPEVDTDDAPFDGDDPLDPPVD